MITHWTLVLKVLAGQKPSMHWGPMLHGVLIKMLPADLANVLHEQRMHPISQYLDVSQDDRAIWHVSLMGDSLAALDTALAEITEVHLDRRANIKIVSRHREEITAQHIKTRCSMAREKKSEFEIRFITPCIQKSLGEYLKFPLIPLLFRNLYMRAEGLLDENGAMDLDGAASLGDMVRIRQYTLQTTPFYIGDTTIIGFMGTVLLGLPNDQKKAGQARYLLECAPYLGVGAKTALGAGGVAIK